MTTELKKRSIIYGAGVFIYVCAIATTTHNMMGDWAKFIWFLIAYLIIGYDVFRVLCEKFFQKKFLTEYTLITLATVGAFGIGRYTEGVLVMLLFELGVIFEAYSTDSAKRSIEEMIDIRPPYATKKSEAGEVKVQPSELEVGDLIVIKPGERIPVDAIVKTGSSMVDTKAVTGESMPRKARESSFIYSGCINLSGVLEAKVVKVYNDSTVSKIMDMVEDAQKRQSESETFISKFSRVYTPVMFCFALFVMIYPPLTFSYGNWSTWVYRGLIFLIAACPSGLVMSVPIAFLGGLASAARQGIVIKGANYLEDLAQADTFVFDKTGTLTEGVFTVREIHPVQTGEEELLEIAAHAESYSNHPIARALLDAYGEAVEKDQVSHVKELPGYGVTAVYDGQKILVGNYHLLEKYEIPMDEVESTGTVIYIAVDKKYAGYIIISDALKKDARWTLRYLKEKCQGVLVMLTGDTESSAMETAQELDMDYAYTDLLPGDKLEQLEDFLMVQDARERLVCVGDGINDAPVLARADVGIAMGALGSAAAIEAADIVLMEDELSKIVDAIRISKETLRVVNHNITFALAIKFMILFFAVVGIFRNVGGDHCRSCSCVYRDSECGRSSKICSIGGRMRKVWRVFPAVLLLMILLTGCGKNPYKEGMEQLEAGQYKEAEVNFKKAVEKEKNLADSCRGLGIACFEQKDYEGARKALKQALKEGTEKTGTIYNLLGACELELGNYEEALSCYEKGLEAEGNSKALKQEMEYNAIVAYEGMEDWEQAKERLAKYTDKYPKDEEAKKEAEFLETR